MQDHSWPPAIPSPVLPMQNSSLLKAARKGKASLWLAGVGIVMALGVFDTSHLLDRYSISQPPPPYFVFTGVGLVCDFFGLWLGLWGRKSVAGKIGAALSLLALVSIPILVFAYHTHNGNWPWLSDDDCSCP